MIDFSLLPDGGMAWLDASGPTSHLVLSTRVRLARNVAGRVFSLRNTARERLAILAQVEEAAAQTVLLHRATCFRLDQLDEDDRHLLHERHLASKELAGLEGNTAVRTGAAVLLRDRLGVMVNEEDHLRLQGLGQVGLTFRGLHGEGSEVVGNFFQLSNQTTLGQSEPELLDHLAKMVRQVVEYEEEARQVLWRDVPAIIEDKVWRAYGLLRHARTLSFEEAMNLLSGVRLGVGLGLIRDVSLYALNKLLIFTQPTHLAVAEGAAVDDPELAVRRATFVRTTLEAEAGRRG